MVEVEELLNHAGTLLASDPKEAERAYRVCLESAVSDSEVMRARYGLGLSLFRQNLFAEARRELSGIADQFPDAIRVAPRLLGSILTFLGRSCIAIDDFQAGIPASRRAVALLSDLYQDSSQSELKDVGEALALACFFCSSAEYQLHDLDQAEVLSKRALSLWERFKGHHCTDVATCLNNLGRICEERGLREQGIAYHREAASIYQDCLGDHPQTAFSLGNLATALAEDGQVREAAALFRRTLSMLAAFGRTEGYDIDGYRHNLAYCEDALKS